jgi:hypothetical protein
VRDQHGHPKEDETQPHSQSSLLTSKIRTHGSACGAMQQARECSGEAVRQCRPAQSERNRTVSTRLDHAAGNQRHANPSLPFQQHHCPAQKYECAHPEGRGSAAVGKVQNNGSRRAGCCRKGLRPKTTAWLRTRGWLTIQLHSASQMALNMPAPTSAPT